MWLAVHTDTSQGSSSLPGVSLFWCFGHAHLQGLPDLLPPTPFLSWPTGPRMHDAVSSPMPMFILVPLPRCSFPPSPNSWLLETGLLSCGSCEKCRTPGLAPDLQNQTLHFNTTPRQSVCTAKSENWSNALLFILQNPALASFPHSILRSEII